MELKGRDLKQTKEIPTLPFFLWGFLGDSPIFPRERDCMDWKGQGIKVGIGDA